jgi:thiamine pyrophosphate-dependent acetolactate synthase large subunit-like protein
MTEKSTVRSVTYDLLRSLGLTTVFGNPGSTEETFLQEFPDDFSYVLALQEASAIAMADAFAQVTRRPALVNLHSSAGVGNAMGNLVAAYHGNTPPDRHRGTAAPGADDRGAVPVMRNNEYSILKSFAVLEETPGVPGLDLPGLGIAALARGWGCRAVDVETTEELEQELKTALTADTTTVIVVRTQPQKAML